MQTWLGTVPPAGAPIGAQLCRIHQSRLVAWGPGAGLRAEPAEEATNARSFLAAACKHGVAPVRLQPQMLPPDMHCPLNQRHLRLLSLQGTDKP